MRPDHNLDNRPRTVDKNAVGSNTYSQNLPKHAGRQRRHNHIWTIVANSDASDMNTIFESAPILLGDGHAPVVLKIGTFRTSRGPITVCLFDPIFPERRGECILDLTIRAQQSGAVYKAVYDSFEEAERCYYKVQRRFGMSMPTLPRVRPLDLDIIHKNTTVLVEPHDEHLTMSVRFAFDVYRPADDAMPMLLPIESWHRTTVHPPQVLAKVPVPPGFTKLEFAFVLKHISAESWYFTAERDDADEGRMSFTLQPPVHVTLSSKGVVHAMDSAGVLVEQAPIVSTTECKAYAPKWSWLGAGHWLVVCLPRHGIVVNIPGPPLPQMCRTPDPRLLIRRGYAAAHNNTHGDKDLTLLVGGDEQPIHVHRALLASMSPVFRTMFGPRWHKPTKEEDTEHKKEKGDVKRTIEQLRLPHDDPRVWHELITWCYYGETYGREEALGLLHLAEQYELGGLKSMCEQWLIDCCDGDNHVEMKELGERYQLKWLLEQAKQESYQFKIHQWRHFQWYPMHSTEATLSRLRWHTMSETWRRLLDQAAENAEHRFEVDGQVFWAHKFVVAARAPEFLRRVLDTEAMPPCHASEMEVLMRHLYCGDTLAEESNAQRILRLAQYFELEVLVWQCETRLMGETMAMTELEVDGVVGALLSKRVTEFACRVRGTHLYEPMKLVEVQREELAKAMDRLKLTEKAVTDTPATEAEASAPASSDPE